MDLTGAWVNQAHRYLQQGSDVSPRPIGPATTPPYMMGMPARLGFPPHLISTPHLEHHSPSANEPLDLSLASKSSPSSISGSVSGSGAAPLDLSIKPSQASQSKPVLTPHTNNTASKPPIARSDLEFYGHSPVAPTFTPTSTHRLPLDRDIQVYSQPSRDSPQLVPTDLHAPNLFTRTAASLVPDFPRRGLPPQHYTDERLHCGFCGYQCEVHQSEEFYRHIIKHPHGAQSFTCIHCANTFRDQSSLTEHLISHPKLYRYVCASPSCHVAFGSHSTLALHMTYIHAGNTGNRASPLSSTAPSSRGPLSHSPNPQHLSRPPTLKPNAPPMPRALPLSPLPLTHDMSPSSQSVPSPSSRRRPATIARSQSSSAPATTASSGERNPTPSSSSSSTPPSSKRHMLFTSQLSQIEAVISHHVAAGNSAKPSDLMFIRCDQGEAVLGKTKPQEINTKNQTLLSMVDGIIERGLRAAPSKPVDKPNINFTVTFDESTDEKLKVPKEENTMKNGGGTSGQTISATSKEAVAVSAADTGVSSSPSARTNSGCNGV